MTFLFEQYTIHIIAKTTVLLILITRYSGTDSVGLFNESLKKHQDRVLFFFIKLGLMVQYYIYHIVYYFAVFRLIQIVIYCSTNTFRFT